MTDHYEYAEKMLDAAESAPATESEGVMTDRVRYALAVAQVRATLALVDAVSYLAGRTGGE